MIITTYPQFRVAFSLPGAPIQKDGLPEWPASKVREAGSGFGDAGSTLVNIPKPARDYKPLFISCNNFYPDATPFTSEYQWYSSARSATSGSEALLPSTASLRFVSSVGNFIAESIDGGENWYKRASPLISTSFLDVSAPSTTHKWAVGASGSIVHSQDSGLTWQTQTSGTAEGLTSVEFVSNTVGWAAGLANTVLYTSNGGTTWSTIATGSAFDIYSATFPTALIGIVAGTAGQTLYTSDGGASWTSVTLSTVFTVNDIDLLPTGTGWAVAGLGHIFKTANYGASYTQQFNSPPNATSLSLSGVSAVNDNVVYIVGEQGYVLKSLNGGTDWLDASISTQANLTGVKFVGPDEGWVCGYDHDKAESVIFYTSDGGTTWETQQPPAGGLLVAIDTPVVNMGLMTFSGTIQLSPNTTIASATLMTPEAVASTFKNCHLYVQRLSDNAVQWVDLLRAMVANTD